MDDKNRHAAATAIIGSADGPTSVFTAHPAGRIPLKLRLKHCIHQRRRRRVEQKITAGAHTLEEVASYAMEQFDAREVPPEAPGYQLHRAEQRQNLMLHHQPELLGITDEASALALLRQHQLLTDTVAQIPEQTFPMDFHLYEIRTEEGSLEIVIEHHWESFSISFSGKKKAMRGFQKIVRALYRYYGVTAQDIQEKTQRYYALVCVLSS